MKLFVGQPYSYWLIPIPYIQHERPQQSNSVAYRIVVYA